MSSCHTLPFFIRRCRRSVVRSAGPILLGCDAGRDLPGYVFSRGEGVGTLEEAHLTEPERPQHVGSASHGGSGAHPPLAFSLSTSWLCRLRGSVPYHTVHTIPCHTIPYHTVPYHTHTIRYHTYPTLPYHTLITPYITIPYHTLITPYITIPYYTIPYHTIPCRTVPFHIIPYHT